MSFSLERLEKLSQSKCLKPRLDDETRINELINNVKHPISERPLIMNIQYHMIFECIKMIYYNQLTISF
jgi:hypothetical protein